MSLKIHLQADSLHEVTQLYMHQKQQFELARPCCCLKPQSLGQRARDARLQDLLDRSLDGQDALLDACCC